MTTLQWFKVAAAYALIFALGLSTIWWLLFRRRTQSQAPMTARLSRAEIEKIERELDVSLPKEYAAFLQHQRPEHIDGTSVIADANQIVSLTKEHRRGYGGAPPWPANYVYIGDESDACPYALDTESGAIVRTDHGHLGKAPLRQFSNLDSFLRGFSAR